MSEASVSPQHEWLASNSYLGLISFPRPEGLPFEYCYTTRKYLEVEVSIYLPGWQLSKSYSVHAPSCYYTVSSNRTTDWILLFDIMDKFDVERIRKIFQNQWILEMLLVCRGYLQNQILMHGKPLAMLNSLVHRLYRLSSYWCLGVVTVNRSHSDAAKR